jgi:hypothetical protein
MPAVKIGLPIDVARDISYWLEGIKQLGGNAMLTLHIRGGNVEEYETSIKQRRQRKKAS